ncbi:hypothetical protein SAMN05660330_01414 [Desulforhopalus singaporensis]|uniref:Uncharacterized protein n=1 Tax=Desulforhopalus singaporensis TaxID=91360 RepID=A0A1H0NRU4_9BACT|nr:hypothetical protein SAMN05660330_01414 [Desulforhopalus singaporensis]
MTGERRPTILVGGKRRDARCYMDRINHRVDELNSASRPRRKRDLLPGEERQLMLPGIDRG